MKFFWGKRENDKKENISKEISSAPIPALRFQATVHRGLDGGKNTGRKRKPKGDGSRFRPFPEGGDFTVT